MSHNSSLLGCLLQLNMSVRNCRGLRMGRRLNFFPCAESMAGKEFRRCCMIEYISMVHTQGLWL